MPQLDDLERYTEIRAIEVTGVRLTEYEAYELMERGVEPWPKATVNGKFEYVYPTSSTPGFSVYALVDRTIKGEPAATIEFTLGGCGVTPPQLRDNGFIFLERGSSYAQAVWQSDGKPYRDAERILTEINDQP